MSKKRKRSSELTVTSVLEEARKNGRVENLGFYYKEVDGREIQLGSIIQCAWDIGDILRVNSLFIVTLNYQMRTYEVT